MPTMVCPNESGLLTINNIDLESACWGILSDLVPLWFIQAVHNDGGVHIPGAIGDLWYPVDVAASTYQLQMMIIGNVNLDGDPYADAWEGLEANINQFRNEIVDPLTTNRGLQPAVLTMPSGEERVADVYVDVWQPGVTKIGTAGICVDGVGDPNSVMHRGVLQITVPSGVFAAA